MRITFEQLAFTLLLINISLQSDWLVISDHDREIVLNAHNYYRSKIASGKQEGFPPAANMHKLTWDNELQIKAHGLASNNKETRSSTAFSLNNVTYGENNIVIKHYAEGFESIPWEIAVNHWHSESKKFTGNISNFNRNMMGSSSHFTQLIWAETTKVGCSASFVKGTAFKQIRIVCLYEPPGNFVSRPIYQIGNACSRCSLCSPEVGLCKVHKEIDSKQEEMDDSYFTELENKFRRKPRHPRRKRTYRKYSP
eukprot:TRINITY_DN8201_c0_g2_i2.p1 TRINITY_DN8201_c0_g2~~TRINITY_DN8201_c0_g2_i2.p1  ORF type:complete len:253 (-),score=-2.59 TRINITY_DN8201_c0_g2_i2:37-795(-)